MSTLITGATGQLGRLIIDALLARGMEATAFVAGGRNPARLEALTQSGVPAVRLDYDDPTTLVSAMQGVETLMLVSASEPGARVAQHAAVLEAAGHAGVRRVVYTSAPHADSSALVLAPEHRATEELIRDSGMVFTILRNNWYTENYLGSLHQARETGELLVSTGEGRVASASRSDFAEAAAVVLTTEGHDGAVYELSGDTAWTANELAAAIGDVIGSPVSVANVSSEEHLARLIATGMDAATAGFLVALDENIRDGALADATGDLRRLLDRATTPLVDGLRVGA